LNLKKESSCSSSNDKKKKKGGIDLNISGKVKTPKIDKPEIKGDFSIPVFELPKSKVEMRKSIPKSKEDIEMNASIPKVSLPKGDVKVDLNLKKKSSSSSSDEKKKKKGGIDLNLNK
jgi:hypothetical protein